MMKIILIIIFFIYFGLQNVNANENYEIVNSTEFEWNDSSFQNGNQTAFYSDSIQIFIDYMIMKYLNQAVVYTCAMDYENRNAQLSLAEAGISSIFIKETTITETKLKRVIPEREPKGIFVNYNCAGVDRLFELASELSLFDDTRAWLVLAGEPAAAVAALRGAALNIDSSVVVAAAAGAGDWYTYDVYNIGYAKGAPLNITFYGVYSRRNLNVSYQTSHDTKYPSPVLINSKTNYTKEEINDQLRVLRNEAELIWDAAKVYQVGVMEFIVSNNWFVFLKDNWVRRRRSMGREVVLNGAFCAVDKPRKGTFKSYLYSRKNLHRDTFTRMYFEMMDYMIEMLQFNMKLIHTKTWGGLVNGSWNGVLGALTRGEADLSLSPMAMKKERVGVGDNNAYACMARFPVIFRQPQASRASLARFVYPLEDRAWLAALPLSLLAILLTMLVMFAEMKFLGPNAENTDITLGNAVISLVCVLYQDGPERMPRLWSGKALLFFMLMFGYLINQFYSASLLGSILMEPPKQINNVWDLIRSRLEYKVEDVSYQWMFFKEHMSFDYVHELYNKKLMIPSKTPPFITADEGLTKTQAGQFAFQTNAAYAYKVMREWDEDVICEVDELLVYPLTRLYARVRRGSPYRQHITTSMLALYERGVQAYVTERWFYKRPRCPPEHAARPRPVAEQFYPALELLAAIGAVSFLILLMEITVARAMGKYQQKTYPYAN